ASGAYLVDRSWAWSSGWVDASLVGVAVLFVVGAGVIGGHSRALRRELAHAGESARPARPAPSTREHLRRVPPRTHTRPPLGTRVATVARTLTDLDHLQQDGAITVQADAADLGQLGEALHVAAAKLGPLDLIVNAVSAARPPDDGSGFGGGAVVAASMAGFDG